MPSAAADGIFIYLSISYYKFYNIKESMDDLFPHGKAREWKLKSKAGQ
jgi:hypothetical protein